MSTDQYEFNAEFQEKILSLMLKDSNFLTDYGDLIEVKYFGDELHQNIVDCCISHLKEYGSAIDYSSLLVRINMLSESGIINEEEVPLYEEYVNTLKELKIDDANFIKDRVVEFAKDREIRISLTKSIDLYKEGKLDDILPNIIEAFMKGRIREKEIDFFAEYAKASQRGVFTEDAIPTGIPLLDKALNGGLNKTEMGVLIGTTSVGKSIGLVYFGKVAAVLGYNVCHLTNELAMHKVANRYAACFTDLSYKHLTDSDIRRDVGEYLAVYGKDLGSKLWIKRFTPSVHTVYDYKAFVESLVNKGNQIDLLIVDHLNDMGRHTKRNSDWAELRDIAIPLRGLADDLNVALWTAAHIKAEYAKRDIIDVYGIGETKRIGDIADVVISLNADTEEAQAKIMRLFVAKQRDGERFQEIQIENDFANMQFFRER